MKLRLGRITALAKAHKPTASQVFCSGILPSVLFDAPIWGYSGQQLRGLRALTGRFLAITGRKRNTDFAFAVHPDSDPEVTKREFTQALLR